MISAEKLTCDVVLEGDTFLGCSFPGDGINDWIASLSSLGTLIVTCFMAWYAWNAWQTAQGQLNVTTDIALAEKRQAAMPEALREIRRLREAYGAGLTHPEIDGLAQDAYLAADIWSATYPTIFTAKCMRPSIARLVELVKSDTYYRNPSFTLTPEQGVKQGMDEKLLETLYISLRDDILSLHGESMTQDQFVERRVGIRGGNK